MNKKAMAIAVVLILIGAIGIIALTQSQAIKLPYVYVKTYSPNLYMNISFTNFTHNKIFYYLIGYSGSNITSTWDNYWFYVINVTQSKISIPVAKAYTNENLSDELQNAVNYPLFDFSVSTANKTQIQVFNATSNSFDFEIIATPIAQNATNSGLPYGNNYSVYSVINNIYQMSVEGYFGGKSNYSNLMNIINLWISQNATSFEVLYSNIYYYSVNVNININAIQKVFVNEYSVYFIDSTGYKYSIYIYQESNNAVNGQATYALEYNFNISNNYEINLTLGQYIIEVKYQNHTEYFNFSLESNEVINLNSFGSQFNVLYFILAIITTFLLSIIVFYYTRNIILSMITFNLAFLIFMSMKIMNFNTSWLFLLIFGNIFYILIKIFGVDKE